MSWVVSLAFIIAGVAFAAEAHADYLSADPDVTALFWPLYLSAIFLICFGVGLAAWRWITDFLAYRSRVRLTRALHRRAE